MSREAIDRAYMHSLTVENMDASPSERVRAALSWIQEVTPLVPEEVMRPLAITVLRDVAKPLLDEDGKPMIVKIMQLMLRKCGCMEEERQIAEELESLVTEVLKRRKDTEGEEWKDV